MKNHDCFKRMLKEHGLKVTIQRLAILDAFTARPGEHLTAEEIYAQVRQEHPETGLATVYRTVQLLSELGLIDKLSLDDGYVRYELAEMAGAKSHHHHHLLCLRCGSVFAFEEDLLDLLEERIGKTQGFQVVDHEVKLYGYCRNCRKK